MAAGILGVGMTMVASVFPVAVDQSRLSGDTTMAALSARSVAAVLRARRTAVLSQCRQPQPNRDPRDTTWILNDQALPDKLRCYNPHLFLYPTDDASSTGDADDRVRTYETTDLWKAGSYVPVVFVTPMDTLAPDTNGRSEGPWRVTIAIYKSRGRPPSTGTYDIPWERWSAPNAQGEPGDYFMDVRDVDSAQRNFRGEAYKVSRIYAGRLLEDPVDDSIVPVAAVPTRDKEDDAPEVFTADRDVNTGRGGEVHNWLSLHGAIAVYHTILGD